MENSARNAATPQGEEDPCAAAQLQPPSSEGGGAVGLTAGVPILIVNGASVFFVVMPVTTTSALPVKVTGRGFASSRFGFPEPSSGTSAAALRVASVSIDTSPSTSPAKKNAESPDVMPFAGGKNDE